MRLIFEEDRSLLIRTGTHANHKDTPVVEFIQNELERRNLTLAFMETNSLFLNHPQLYDLMRGKTKAPLNAIFTLQDLGFDIYIVRKR